MLTEPLPKSLDIRKAAARGVSIEGVLEVLEMPRFWPLLAGDEGLVQARFTCSRDEENRFLVALSIEVDVAVTCQRCLDPMPIRLVSENVLAVVGGDEQAAQLPRHLDPLIVEGELCNLRDVVEDELILALPPFSYHPRGQCEQIETGASQAPDQGDNGTRPNPFDVLAQLKPGREQ
jgi:uncharacterized protein